MRAFNFNVLAVRYYEEKIKKAGFPQLSALNVNFLMQFF